MSGENQILITPSQVVNAPLLGRGFFWQDLAVGQCFSTFRRTITETDLVNFISVTGMLEPIFFDTAYQGAIAGRPVPAALTYTLIEGFLLRTLVQGTGLALLDMSQRIHAPVRIGDTVWARVEITEVRPTSRSGRAVVRSTVTVINQRDETVLTYDVKRLQAGRPAVWHPQGRQRNAADPANWPRH